jgi:hypothetical protein
MKRRAAIVVALLGVLALGACTQNPLSTGPSGNPMAPLVTGQTGYFGVAEVLNANVVYSPPNNATTTTYAMFHPSCSAADATAFGGGLVQYSWGGTSQVMTSVSAPGLAAQGGIASIQSSSLILRTPGIGGLNGDFQNDYYVHFEGYKGPNASTDFCSLVVNLFPGANTFADLSCYRGFIFYARGNARFGVQLSAPKCASCPYKDYNFYEYIFGDQLSQSSWKEFVVNFTDMQQQYGASVDFNGVVKEVTALQFIQETPYTQNFKLDVDYIRFF